MSTGVRNTGITAFLKTGNGAVFIVKNKVVAVIQRPDDYDPDFAWTASTKKQWFVVDEYAGIVTFVAGSLKSAEAICREQYAA